MGMRWLLGIILIAIISLLAAWAGFSPFNSEKQSDLMVEPIEAALSGEGFQDVTFNMDGNVAVLAGNVSSDALKAEAEKLAANATCETCGNPDFVWHTVQNTIDVTTPVVAEPVVPTISPFSFSAAKDAAGVSLNGYVRNDAELQRLLREADTMFGGNVKNDTLLIAKGAPNDGWGDMASSYLSALSKLDTGNVVLDDTHALITGVTTNEAVRNEIYDMIKQTPAGYEGAANITIPDGPIAVAGKISNERSCQTLFNSLKSGKKIEFASGSADIKAESFGLLSSLYSAADQCDTFNVSIAGFTDNSPFVGEDGQDLNIWLSQARADSVKRYLVQQGIAATRLATMGYGSANPIASNDTPEGKAANRRIEFTVNKSE